MTLNKKYIIGLTGPTGSGKSKVAGLFKDYNAHILDVDKYGHIALEHKQDEIVSFFGYGILKTAGSALEIDRKKLGEIVFSSNSNLEILNNIVHKHITELVYKDVYKKLNESNGNIIIIDAALLFNLKLHLICTHTILVLCSKKKRLQRIMKRDKISKETAMNRIKSQEDYRKFKSIVDVVIFNND
ncbi:MAG: dephospho-CoA kinase [Defluviitaleaceae bacterium]|nr:dephospho-CoA kinase [Defluviitaleaceae bacterium]